MRGFVVWETAYSPIASTAKYFQRFKISKYLQNTACISFELKILKKVEKSNVQILS